MRGSKRGAVAWPEGEEEENVKRKALRGDVDDGKMVKCASERKECLREQKGGWAQVREEHGRGVKMRGTKWWRGCSCRANEPRKVSRRDKRRRRRRTNGRVTHEMRRAQKENTLYLETLYFMYL
jgi:hypothetical protein